MTKQPLSELFRNRNFMLVWWAGLTSMLGNYMLFIALPVYIFDETGSMLSTAFSVMGGGFATIVVGQVAGVFVDRWNYKRTLVIANSILVFVTLALLLTLHMPWWVVIPIAFLQSSVGQFLGPAENALLPTLVNNKLLASANSFNSLNNNLARLIGPALGGLLLTTVGFAGVVIVDAVTYLIAALLILAVKAPDIKREVSQIINPYKRVFLEWQEGLQTVRSSHSLTLSFVVVALIGLGEGAISTLMAPYVKVMLGGGGLELGYIMSSQAVGGILGSLLLTTFVHKLKPLHLLGWSALSSGLLLIPLLNYPLFYPELWPALVLTAIAGFPFAAFGASQMTLLQTESSERTKGRVFSSYFALFAAAQLIGMLGSGLLADRVGVLVINIDAVVYILAGVVVLVGSRRHFSSRVQKAL
jgi:predicted MFS family arabinose efflux permease